MELVFSIQFFAWRPFFLQMATAEAEKTVATAPAPAEGAKVAEEVVKMDLFEDDDEFEEFEIDEGKVPDF